MDSDACSKYLKIFTNRNCENTVGGNATYAATVFLSKFQTSILTVDKLNHLDSADEFFDYIYHQRNNKSLGFLQNLSQSSLTAGNAKYKGEEVNVARLISLYNEFCDKVLHAKLKENSNHAIGYTSDAYNKFIKSADADIRLRVDEIAKQTI